MCSTATGHLVLAQCSRQLTVGGARDLLRWQLLNESSRGNGEQIAREFEVVGGGAARIHGRQGPSILTMPSNRKKNK